MTEWEEALRIRRLATTPCQISWANWNIDRVRGVNRPVPVDACAYPWNTPPAGGDNTMTIIIIIIVAILGWSLLKGR